MTESADPAPRRGQPPRFRRATVKLAPDAARRQGEVTHLAFLSLGGRDAALAFLNNPDDSLGGRPIDVAVASADGAAKVAGIIRRMADEGDER